MSRPLRVWPTLLACVMAGTGGVARAAPAPTPAPVASPPSSAPSSPPAAETPKPGEPPAVATPAATPVAPLAVPEAPPDAPITPVAVTPLGPDPQSDAAALAGADPAVAAPAGTAPLAQSVTRGDEVFGRIRRNLGSNVCVAGGNSDRWRRRYASNPAMFANRIEQILPLLDFVSAEVERAGLPSEFVFIPLVESWYKPDAMSGSGPAGMWQMIGTTARNHGIHITAGYDGRLSPVESTRAALSYLRKLHGMFGDWEATVMAYNAGEGRILQAFKRARSRDTSGDRRRPHGLSNITYDYVSKLQALSCLVSQPERSGLRLPRASRFVPLAPVLMDSGIASIDQFASRRGRDAGELRRLNPGYKSGRVPSGVPRLVLMPLGVPQADVSRASGPALAAAAPTGAPSTTPATGSTLVVATLPNATRLVVGGTDPAVAAAAALADAESRAAARRSLVAELVAARPIAVAVSSVQDAVPLPATAASASPAASAPKAAAAAPAAATPLAGAAPPATNPQTVAAQVAAASDAVAAAPVGAIGPGGPTATTHRVVAGESLWTIARLHQLSVEDLRQLNRLERRDVVHPGDTLKLAP